jgi:hypothetical protein
MRDEGGLHRMELVASRHPFDRQDLRAVLGDRESKTRIDSSAIDQDRAGAALAAVAPLLRSGQVEAFAQQIEERDARIVELDVPLHAIHR